MAKNMSMPRFIPHKVAKTQQKVTGPVISNAKVVITVRIAPKVRDALHMVWRSGNEFDSVSHVIQTAIDEFLARRA